MAKESYGTIISLVGSDGLYIEHPSMTGAGCIIIIFIIFEQFPKLLRYWGEIVHL